VNRRVRSPGILAMALGLLTVAWPLAWAPAWIFTLGGVAAAAVVAAAVLHWRPGPGLAVAAAIVSCAFSAAGVAVLAAEGLFILGYLLAVDAPAGLAAPGRWLRRQVPLLVAGLITAGPALAAYAVQPSAAAWLALAGLAAAVAAYLAAISPRLARFSMQRISSAEVRVRARRACHCWPVIRYISLSVPAGGR